MANAIMAAVRVGISGIYWLDGVALELRGFANCVAIIMMTKRSWPSGGNEWSGISRFSEICLSRTVVRA